MTIEGGGGMKLFGPKETHLIVAGRAALSLLDAYIAKGARRPNDMDRVAVREDLAVAIAILLADGPPR